jgi:hypothetical protein
VTTEGKAIKLLDELLTLFRLYEEDYSVIDDALEAIAAYRKTHPDHPITVSLADHMREKGFL